MQFKIIDVANRQDLLQSINQAFKPAVLLPSLAIGVLIWVTGMVLGNSYSAFVFHGQIIRLYWRRLRHVSCQLNCSLSIYGHSELGQVGDTVTAGYTRGHS